MANNGNNDQFLNPKGTSVLHGKQWVNIMIMMINAWPKGWYHKVISFDRWNGIKHKGMFGKVVNNSIRKLFPKKSKGTVISPEIKKPPNTTMPILFLPKSRKQLWFDGKSEDFKQLKTLTNLIPTPGWCQLRQYIPGQSQLSQSPNNNKRGKQLRCLNHLTLSQDRWRGKTAVVS